MAPHQMAGLTRRRESALRATQACVIFTLLFVVCSAVLPASAGVTQGATFEVTYREPTATDPEVLPFPQEARDALEYVLNTILGRLIISPIPIKVEAKWLHAPNVAKVAVGETPSTFGGFPGAIPETFYSSALADALSGSDVAPGRFDITLSFADHAPWYLGTDGAAGTDQVDFVTVALHELIHGLGFTGSMRYADAEAPLPSCGDGLGCWGLPAGNGMILPFIFDRFAETPSGERLLDLPNHSVELGQALRQHVVFDHEYVREAHDGEAVRLWTPASWDAGGSYAHLDPGVSGNDLLMFPTASPGEAQHHPGPIALAILEAMGFRIHNNDHFRSRFPLEAWSGHTSGNNRYATRQPGEPAHSFDGTIGTGSLWWQWTAPASGLFTIDTHGSSFDTRIAVYRGADLSSLQWITSQDFVNGTEYLTLSAIGGTTYQIAIEGALGESGNVSLRWSLKNIDVSIAARDLSDPAFLGSPFSYVIAISNESSTQRAEGVTLAGPLPNGLRYVGAEPDGLCAETEQGFACALPPLDVKTIMSLEIQALPEATGAFHVDFSALAERDMNYLNNTIGVDTTVLDPSLLILPFERRLASPSPTANDLFGHSVDIQGDTAVVGAPQAGAADEGKAYVFRWNGSQWVLWQELRGSDLANGDGFGRSIAISGDVIAVGAPFSDSAGLSSGAVYLFHQEADAWIERQKLVASDAGQNGEFGSSLSILDAWRIMIGSPGDDDRGAGSGSAYIYERSQSGWVFQNKLVAPDGTPGDRFGTSVAVDGFRSVVGAPFADGVVSTTGAAYYFEQMAGIWSGGRNFLTALGGDRVGNSVSLGQDLLVVGLPHGNNNGETGAVFGYRWSGSDWVEKQMIPIQPAPSDQFGWAVDLSGSRAIVGAPLDDDRGSASGSAFIVDYQDGAWVERRKLIGRHLRGGDVFGQAVAIDGTRAIVGAPSEPDPQSATVIRTGGAYIFNTDSLSNVTISLQEPSSPGTYYKGDSLVVGWTSQNTFPSDSIKIEIKRDTTPRSLGQPDGLNWYVFPVNTDNSGSHTVILPNHLATADDWRLYVSYRGLNASDATDFTFSISTRPPEPPPCAAGDGFCLYTVDPCRILDTRSSSPLTSGVMREIPVAGTCGIPVTARAVVLNVTAVSATGFGNVALWPADLPQPGTSVVNFLAGQARANSAIIGIASATGALAARSFVAGSGIVHLVIDVSGYFQ